MSHEFATRDERTHIPQRDSVCEFPRCVEGEKPPYCGNCGDRPTREEAAPSVFPLRCLVCDRTLTPVREGRTQPNDGLTFVATGNYGSRVYDPFARSMQLHVVVCDECVTERIERIVGVTAIQARPAFDYRPLVSVEELLDEA